MVMSESPASNLSRVPLAQLVQQIGDIIAQGDDATAGTPSQYRDYSDARLRLRSVLLQLVDVGLSSSGSRELGAVIQLLRLTLDKVPNWLAGDSCVVLMQLVDRFLLLMMRCNDVEMKQVARECMGKTLIKVSSIDWRQFELVIQGWREQFNDVCKAAKWLCLESSRDTCTIKRRCPWRPLTGDSPLKGAYDAESIHVSTTDCENIVSGILSVLALVSKRVPAAARKMEMMMHSVYETVLWNSSSVQTSSLEYFEILLLSLSMKSAEKEMLLRRVEALSVSAISAHRDRISGIHELVALHSKLVSIISILWHDALSCFDLREEKENGRNLVRRLFSLVASMVKCDLPMGQERIAGLWATLFAEMTCNQPTLAWEHLEVFSCVYQADVVALPVILNSFMFLLQEYPLAGIHRAVDLASMSIANILSQTDDKVNLMKLDEIQSRKRRRLATTNQDIFHDDHSISAGASDCAPPLVRAVQNFMLSARHTLVQLQSSDERGTDFVIKTHRKISMFLCVLAYLHPTYALKYVDDIFSTSQEEFQRHKILANLMAKNVLFALAFLNCEQWTEKLSKMCLRILDKCMKIKSYMDPVSRAVFNISTFYLDILDTSVHSDDIKVLASGDCDCDFACLIPILALTKLYEVEITPQKGAAKKKKQSFVEALLEISRMRSQNCTRILQGLGLALEHWPNKRLMLAAAVGAPMFHEDDGEKAGGNFPPSLSPLLSTVIYSVVMRNEEEEEDRDMPTTSLLHVCCKAFHTAAATGSPEWRQLAQFVMKSLGNDSQKVRLALLKNSSVFNEEQFILALTLSKEHPINSKERHLASVKGEHDIVKHLKNIIASSQDENGVTEDAIQAIGLVSLTVTNRSAVIVAIAVIVFHLQSKDPIISALAAQSLTGISRARNLELRKLIFHNNALMELVAPQLLRRRDLLHELSELLSMEDRVILHNAIPFILPSLCDKGTIKEIEHFGDQLGLTPQKLLQQYGHFPFASSLMTGVPTTERFIALLEDATGVDFVDMAAKLAPKTLSEMVLQTGGDSAWDSSSGALPDQLLSRIYNKFKLLLSDKDGTDQMDVASELAEGDHITRMLKELGDKLDSTMTSVKESHESLRIFRSVIVLIKLSGRFVGRFLPQFLVLLSSSIQSKNPVEVRVQGLIGWAYFVRSLASDAPIQLGGVSNQVIVALLDCLQEPGVIGTAALRALEVLVDACKKLFPEKLNSMPPIPQCSAELMKMNEMMLGGSKNMTVRQKLESLIEGLGDEAISVRVVTLRELQRLLSTQRQWLLSLSESSDSTGDSELLKKLVTALMKSCEPEASSSSSLAAQQLCAELLGMIGALDPSRLKLESESRIDRSRTLFSLAYDLMTKRLTKILKTAPNMNYLELTTLAIQDMLRCHLAVPGSMPKGSKRKAQTLSLFDALPKETQALIRPYLESKYSMTSSGRKPTGRVFSKDISFRRWLGLWLTQLTESLEQDEFSQLFKAINPVIRFDIPTAMSVAPYIILACLNQSPTKAIEAVVSEINAVIDTKVFSREGVMCSQTIFYILDTLHWWFEDAKVVNSSKDMSGEEHDMFAKLDWSRLQQMLESIPKIKLSAAATKCGAHARALLYYEAHLRGERGGAANNAAATSASFEDENVSMLLGIYDRLEEPDGIDGIMKLRKGARKVSDQRLAAEKNGSWAEALTLYELDLKKRSNASTEVLNYSESTKGYLNCLLQMGHWEGLIYQVEGLLSGKNVPERLKGQIAALGTAALWRMGSFDSKMKSYLDLAAKSMEKLSFEEKWELGLGKLLQGLYTASSGQIGYESVFESLKSIRSEVISHFSAAAKESFARAYPHLIKLHMIQEISDVSDILKSKGALVGPKERHRCFRWKERLSITQPTLASQAPILDLRRQLASFFGAEDDVGKCWIEYARLCRSTDHQEAAIASVLEACSRKVPGSSLEQVEILYARGETHRALQEIQGVEVMLASGSLEASSFSSKKERDGYLSSVLLRQAQWTAEMGQGTREEVVSIFQRALSLHGSAQGWEAGLFQYAVYLDQYMMDAKSRQAQTDSFNRPMYDRLGGKSRVKMSEHVPYYIYLPEVIEAYGKCAIAGVEYIYRSLPRMLTLWFEFGTDAMGCSSGSQEAKVANDIMALMRGFAKKISIPCWMTSLPQLISRICHRNSEVATITRSLITEAASVYPQQVLWALAGVSKSGRSNRRSAANSIINSAKRKSPETSRRLFAENSALCEQLYKLCHYSPPSSARVISARKSFSHLSRVMPLGVIVPTMTSLNLFQEVKGNSESKLPPIESHEQITIADIHDDIQIMLSLMKPKRVVFIGSDGKDYAFLAKPKDDLRKDNRMMEVAGVINRLFKDDPYARRRDLYLRRFAVIPITEDCGLVEWVEQTRPVRSCISDVFAESPQIIKSINQEIKVMYNKAAAAYKDSKGRGGELVQWLDEVLKQYPPCFHSWFLRTYPEPAAWLNAKIAFTRTYAVWCVVGHVVGLGDRHLENVLIDKASGDAVQIDFGCLFDKGLTLPQPEVVPFRLTQNIIDAFGISGVDGVYRNSFENTLSVLRAHQENIVSIMDTFVHDPLVDWTKTEEKRGFSGNEKETDNPQARDWLATIRGRLQGTLLGVTSKPCMPLSVEGQTQRLIQEATSKENLSRMYIWWQAWY